MYFNWQLTCHFPPPFRRACGQSLARSGSRQLSDKMNTLYKRVIIIIIICIRMWNLKCMIIPVIIGTTGIVTRSWRKNLEDIPGKYSIDSLQKTTILGTSHIIREILQLGITAGSREVPGRKGPWQETIIIVIIIIIHACILNITILFYPELIAQLIKLTWRGREELAFIYLFVGLLLMLCMKSCPCNTRFPRSPDLVLLLIILRYRYSLPLHFLVVMQYQWLCYCCYACLHSHVTPLLKPALCGLVLCCCL